MPKTDETLAGILAEMRTYADRLDDAGGAPSPTDLRKFAERIERAANNLESSFGMALSIEDGLRKRDKQSAPGDAAALREALENVERVAKYCAETPRHTPGYPTDAARADVLYSRIAELGRVARAALAAPARNCDRFKTLDEAREAFQDLRGHKILADVELWDSMDEAGALVRWLFAPAEGGKE